MKRLDKGVTKSVDRMKYVGNNDNVNIRIKKS